MAMTRIVVGLISTSNNVQNLSLYFILSPKGPGELEPKEVSQMNI